MAPIQLPTSPHTLSLIRRVESVEKNWNGSWRKNASTEAFVIEAWTEGFMVGALLIMSCVTVANMRKGVLLHKLILLELLLAMPHGTFCFMAFNGYGWYLSGTAMLLYCSYFVHNIVAWIKIRPFFMDSRSLFKAKTGKIVSKIYIVTLAMTIPPLILQIVDNYRYFNNINDLYEKVRPAEPLFRDPWWIFTCLTLFHVIRKCYGSSVLGLIGRSPRFGILLAAICLAIIFTIMDIIGSVVPAVSGNVDGVVPWWKLSLVFKCLTDNIMLDDFKTELKKLGDMNLERTVAQSPGSPGLVTTDKSKEQRTEVETAGNTGGGPGDPNGGQNTILGGLGRRASLARDAVGRVGTKITHLPSLGQHDTYHTVPKRRAMSEASANWQSMSVPRDFAFSSAGRTVEPEASHWPSDRTLVEPPP